MALSKRMIWFLLASGLIGASLAPAGPPPNDNFTNRIALTGSDISFTGTLAGATTEDNADGFEVGESTCVGGTVWWSWTATQTSAVFLESLDSLAGINPYGYYACMTVWPAPEPEGSFPLLTGAPGFSLLTNLFIYPNVRHAYRIFDATNGATYHFQLKGYWTNLLRFHLTASIAPVIYEEPRSLTVSEGASALFMVAAASLAPLQYQWQFNETDIPGATNIVLTLTNVAATQAGNYRAFVSNAGGTSTSATASLWISLTDLRPVLSVSTPPSMDRFAFAVAGETGRAYRVESSLDLIQWTPETSFDSDLNYDQGGNLTSVVRSVDSISALDLAKGSDRKYFRASRYIPPNEICNMNLKVLAFAKELWAQAGNRQPTAVPAYSDLAPFLGPIYKVGSFYDPRCPEGGYYLLWGVSRHPSCTIPGHVLEEPR